MYVRIPLNIRGKTCVRFSKHTFFQPTTQHRVRSSNYQVARLIMRIASRNQLARSNWPVTSARDCMLACYIHRFIFGLWRLISYHLITKSLRKHKKNVP